MLVRFKVNLGTNDSIPLGLDYKLCGKGMELDVAEKAGAWLVAKGHAVEVEEVQAVAKPAEIQGVPESKPAPPVARHKPEKSNPSKES